MSSRSSNNYPQFKGYHRVGFVQSAHGIRGEVFIKLFAGVADWRDGAESLWLLPDGAGAPLELKIRALRPHKEGLVVSLTGVADRNAAEGWRGAQVYVDDALLESAPGEPIFLKEILGFRVVDPGDVVLGEITDFATNGAQDLLVLRRASDGARALVPFVEAFVVDIDFDKRVIRMDLPDGLLSLGDR